LLADATAARPANHLNLLAAGGRVRRLFHEPGRTCDQWRISIQLLAVPGWPNRLLWSRLYSR